MAPPADNIPGSFQPSEQLVGLVAKALDASSDSASIVMAAASVSDSASLAELLVFHVDALKELAIRTGGNPFDNTRTEYPGLTRGGKRIAEARRVRSDAAAERYLRRFYTRAAACAFRFLQSMSLQIQSCPTGRPGRTQAPTASSCSSTSRASAIVP